MCLLSVDEIKLIEEEVQDAHISYSHLEYDLIDHICCDVESRMEDGSSFDEAFAKVKETIGRRGLKQIQQNTLLLIDKNYRIMKKSMKTLGVVALALMALAALFKIMHWPFAGPMLILSFFIVIFFFFPSAMYVVYKEMFNKKKAGVIITGTLGGALFMSGILFKVMHWPVAGIIITVGALLIAVFLIQAAISSKIKSPKGKTLHPAYFAGMLAIMLYVLGFLFRIMHWPGAFMLITISTMTLAVVFLPWIAIKNYSESKSVTREFIFTVCALIYFLMFGFLLALNHSRNIMDDFVPVDKNFTTSTYLLEKKNNELYSQIQKDISLNNQMNKIRSKANELDEYTEYVKLKLVTYFENVSEEQAFKMIENPDLLQNKTIQVSDLMFKDGDKSLAVSLKYKIEDYKSVLIQFIEDDTEKYWIHRLLNTDRSIPYGNMKYWEDEQFLNMFLLAALNNLSAIQHKVRLIEHETVKSLYQLSLVSTEKNR